MTPPRQEALGPPAAALAEEGRQACAVPLARAAPNEYHRRVRALYASSGAVILGNVLEWYDWTVFGYMEDLIADIFMGGRQLNTWLIFAIPFIARPLGSVLFGWVGDHCGRTVALNTAIWGMALSTVLQGCLLPDLPGAPCLLAILRFVAGLSAGGEAAGVNTYMTEVGGEDRDHTLAAAVGVNNVSGSLAFFLANAVSLAVHQLPRSTQLAWAWRVPFLLAGPVGAVSVILRRRMRETEAFRAVEAARAAAPRKVVEQQETGAAAPAKWEEVEGNAEVPATAAPKEAVKAARSGGWRGAGELRAVVLVVLVVAPINSCNYLPLYLVRWLQHAAGFSVSGALALAALMKVVQLVMTWPVSFVADSVGATKTMLWGGVASACCILPALLLVIHAAGAKGTLLQECVAYSVLGFGIPLVVGFYSIPAAMYMTSLFPAEFRGRGAGIGLGLASLSGGFTPALCGALAMHGDWLPGLFITLMTVPSLLILQWSRREARCGRLPVYQRPWLF